MKVLAVAVAVISMAWAGAAAAQEQPASNTLLNAVVNCKAEADEQARLRCYDAAVSALSQATSSGTVVVVDREDVRKTRRSLFGFSLPKLPFFTGDDSQDEAPEEIEAKIKTVRGLGYGKWLFELDSGGRWQTTEATGRAPDPRAGDAITIKRGIMGSFFLSIDGRRAVKGMRVG